MSASDQNSNMPFLRNEFLKIFEDVFMMTLFTKMTHKFHVGYILKHVGCKTSPRKSLKLNGTPESHPTAWGLRISDLCILFNEKVSFLYQHFIRLNEIFTK